MTKEELEKEAEGWLRKFLLCNDCKRKCHCIELNAYCEEQVLKAYIDSAEPREKRITELESTNKKISDECHKLVDSLEKKQNENELLETQNIKLQAEVSRLTIKNAELKETVIKMNKVITETFSNLTKAKELLKKLKALYFSPVVTKDDVKRQDEILVEVEQFLSEVANG